MFRIFVESLGVFRMAVETFKGIRSEVDIVVTAIDIAAHQNPVDVLAIERELVRLQSLSSRIGVLIERLRETWG